MAGHENDAPPDGAVFCYTEGEELEITPAMKESYLKNGFVLIRDLFSAKELGKINYAISACPDVERNSIGREDDGGRKSTFVLWNHPGDDILGTVARTRKVARTAQELMGGDEVYHYHTKLMMKKGRVGGAHIWHQDYGYWYRNGCMFPDMSSVFIAIDDCSKENGCLQVLQGSHLAGRIEHGTVGEQAGADLERVDHLATVCPLRFVQMAAGDALFFHCNLLHRSFKNDSDWRRFVLIPAFNKRSNNPLWKHHHPQYTPLDVAPNDAILKCDRLTSSYDKWFMQPDEDSSFVTKGAELKQDAATA
ncbi:L-proline trans-4-hydroxylase-like [Pollicipes pollicipes]|uniref:L-proline trans-4-hydroxylase-like n=1 Tax=Pollicipes pollicipes TaxID=41117 RepID=UPI001884EB10|nr:L-proline trans-4-hydroxylase-like [Pollicipes pollicipes]